MLQSVSKARQRVYQEICTVGDAAAGEEMALMLKEFTRGFIRHTYKNLSKTICLIQQEICGTQQMCCRSQGGGGRCWRSHGDTGTCLDLSAQDLDRQRGGKILQVRARTREKAGGRDELAFAYLFILTKYYTDKILQEYLKPFIKSLDCPSQLRHLQDILFSLSPFCSSFPLPFFCHRSSLSPLVD